MKNFEIAISPYDSKEIAIISKSNGKFTPLASTKKSKALAKIKRKFKSNLCSTTSFCFSWMSPENLEELKLMLKK